MQLISYYGLQTNFSPFLDSATRFWFVSFKEYDPKLWVEGIASSSLLIFSPHCFPPFMHMVLGVRCGPVSDFVLVQRWAC